LPSQRAQDLPARFFEKWVGIAGGWHVEDAVNEYRVPDDIWLASEAYPATLAGEPVKNIV
jgi:hypothetical protein